MNKAIYYIYIIPIFLSAISSLQAFRLKWPFSYRLFSIFLFAVLIVELFAILWKDYLFLYKDTFGSFSPNNMWLYNIFFIPQYLFYFWFFSSVIRTRLINRIMKVVLTFFAGFATVNIIAIQGLFTANTFTLVAACLIMLSLIITYFFKLIRQPQIIQLHKEPLVWISLGAFLFHLGCLPFFIWFNDLVTASLEKAYFFMGITVVLNSIMYLSYSIAFLWNKHSQVQAPST